MDTPIARSTESTLTAKICIQPYTNRVQSSWREISIKTWNIFYVIQGVGVDGVFNNDEAVDNGTADHIRDCEGVVRTVGAVVVGLDRTISENDAEAGVTESFGESGPRINEALEDSAVAGAKEYPVDVAGVSKPFEEFAATRNKP